MSEEIIERRLEGKNITVGICGCGAIEDIFKILRMLRKEGANVEIILTPNAAEIMPLVLLQRETSKPILYEQMTLPKVFDAGHKEKTDLLLIAPATANTIGKVACGIGDNLLTSRVLSSRCPVVFGISCNPIMFEKPAVQRNLKQIREDGYIVLENPEKPNRLPNISDLVDTVVEIINNEEANSKE